MAIYDPTLLTRSGVTPDNLWEAAGIINDNFNDISEGIERAVDGLSYQNAVLDKDLAAAPTSLITIGSRYIVAFGVTSLDPWYGHIDEIAELVDDTPYTWEFITPSDGWWLHVIDENLEYLYNESDWVSRPAATLHNSLAEKQGGNAEDDEYYHLTQDEVGYLPTTDQKDALAGTGTPSDSNVYVTSDDSRLTNSRTPNAHAFIDTTGHSAAGLTAGHIVTATAATTYAFQDAGLTVNGYTAKTAPVDTDYLPLMDSETTPTANLIKKLSWAYVKSVLKTYFDGLYSGTGHTHSYSSTDHDGTHVTSGSDEIDGDKLDIDWDATNYTPSTCTEADNVDNLTAHLKGVDNALGNKSASNHTHGDLPTSNEKAALAGTGTPSATNKYVTKDSLIAAIYGIGEFKDNVLDKDLTAPPISPTLYDAYIVASVATGLWTGQENSIAKWNSATWDFYAASEGDSTYVADEDLIYVYTGSAWQSINNYALATAEPPSVSSSSSGAIGNNTTVARSDHSHDLGTHSHTGSTDGGALSYAAADHDASHITSGTDEIDGDKLDVDFTPANYTPTLVTNIADSVDNLSAHLQGIDTALSSVGVADDSITLAKLDHGTQGDVLIYSTTGTPTRLGHGDAGQALVSGGHGADAAWGNVAGYITVTGTAGEALSQYDIVYTDTADSGKYKKADKDVLATADAVGIVTQAGGITNGATGEITLGERLITTGTWTKGGIIYLSGTAGAMTQTVPATGYCKPVGRATETNQIMFKPEPGYQAGDEIDADKLAIDWTPTNYTPTDVAETDSATQLSGHLKGIDNAIAPEVIQDAVGAMVGSNVETGIAITYDDTNGKLDAYVEPYDVVGGRLDLVSATSLKWGFQDSNQIRLYNPTSTQWELVKCSAEPTLANTATDLNGTALAVDKIYDVFAEYSNATSFTLKCSRWVTTGTGGNSARLAAYASGTAYAIGDRVTDGGHDYVCIQAGTGQAPSSSPTYWQDNGTSVSGDFAGLYRHDGVIVSDSSATGKKRRWLGIIYTFNNSSTVNFKDDVNYRYISNYYNRKSLIASAYNTTNSWSSAGTSAWIETYNGSGAVRAKILTCVSCAVTASLTGLGTQPASPVNANLGVSLNCTDNYSMLAKILVLASVSAPTACITNLDLPCGYSYVTMTEYTSGALTLYSNSGSFSKILVQI